MRLGEVTGGEILDDDMIISMTRNIVMAKTEVDPTKTVTHHDVRLTAEDVAERAARCAIDLVRLSIDGHRLTGEEMNERLNQIEGEA